MDDQKRKRDAVSVRMIQEELRGQANYGWKTLVACILMNRATGDQARPVLGKLLDRWPTPSDLSRAEEADVLEVVHPLGFQKARARNLIQMSDRFLRRVPVKDLPGVGPYALESWRIFVEDDLDFVPQDAKLRSYVKGRKT